MKNKNEKKKILCRKNGIWLLPKLYCKRCRLRENCIVILCLVLQQAVDRLGIKCIAIHYLYCD